MISSQRNIVILQDYKTARDLLKQENVKSILAEKRAELRNFDIDVLNLMEVKHKLKDAQLVKEKSIKFERAFSVISYWLEDEIAVAVDEKDKEAKKLLLEQCKELIATHERVKKNISDDFAKCRFETLTPLTIGGFLGGAPLTAAALGRLLSDKPSVVMRAAIIGEAIALSLVFHGRTREFSEIAKKAIASSPRQFRSATKKVRNSFAAAVVALSVGAKQINQIEPRYPTRSKDSSQLVIAAKAKHLRRIGSRPS